jgi:tetratricopeptide (TPR) repeat protein
MLTLSLLWACGGEPAALPGEAPSRPPSGWDAELARLDAEIAALEGPARERPDDWVRSEEVAGLFRSRARLTGDYDDLAEAERWLQSAFDHAPEGAGPWMSRARLHFTLHRLDLVEPDVEMAERRLLLDDVDHAGFTLLRADVAYQQGRYDDARDGIAGARTLHDDLAADLSEAQLLWHTGDPDAALAWFDDAEGRYHGFSAEPRAWLHLQRGLVELDRGRWDEAMAHYEAADAEMSGWWLVDEHRAEILALRGDTDEARALYVDIVERTGNPEFMDALAGIARDRGYEIEATAWIARARAAYDEQLARFPEAAAGHALQHHLDFGADPTFTLELAEHNAAQRPNGEALTLLALAQLGAGAPEKARATIEGVLATPWRSAATHVAAATIYDTLGESELAEVQRAAAVAIDPHSLD